MHVVQDFFRENKRMYLENGYTAEFSFYHSQFVTLYLRRDLVA